MTVVFVLDLDFLTFIRDVADIDSVVDCGVFDMAVITINVELFQRVR